MDHVAASVNRKHMRHCFDYLRRALMCAADTNLEAVSPAHHVTTGWGSPRVCRDYGGVLAWAERWRNSDDEGISELNLADAVAVEAAIQAASAAAAAQPAGSEGTAARGRRRTT